MTSQNEYTMTPGRAQPTVGAAYVDDGNTAQAQAAARSLILPAASGVQPRPDGP
jgi:hypothetical protein